MTTRIQIDFLEDFIVNETMKIHNRISWSQGRYHLENSKGIELIHVNPHFKGLRCDYSLNHKSVEVPETCLEFPQELIKNTYNCYELFSLMIGPDFVFVPMNLYMLKGLFISPEKYH